MEKLAPEKNAQNLSFMLAITIIKKLGKPTRGNFQILYKHSG